MQKIDKPKMVEIVRIVDENPHVKTFYINISLQSSPGQFVMLWLPGVGQKPFSISYDDNNILGLSVFKRGPFTGALFKLKTGDRVGISGPYGTCFSILPNTHYIAVAGGYGAAPLGFLAEKASFAKNVSIDFCIGARNKDYLLFENQISTILCTKLHIATDDGDVGHKGYVTDLLQNILEERSGYSRGDDINGRLDGNKGGNKQILVCTCGPELMEKEVLRLCNKYNVQCEISIERYMKCGFGLCGQCAVDELGLCMCKHGPVVDKSIANRIKEFGEYERDKSGAKSFFNGNNNDNNIISKKNMDTKDLILKLHEINAIKFGEFKLKTGSISPIYLDLRVTVSYPELLKLIADIMWEKVANCKFDLICGVPYTALPIATAMSLKHNMPMVMRRKEVKDYGIKRALEGVYEKGQTCLIVEDLITSGSSVFETIDPLEHEGLKIQDIIVLLDREQSGKENIKNRGYNLHTVFTMREMLSILFEENKIDKDVYDKVIRYIEETQVKR